MWRGEVRAHGGGREAYGGRHCGEKTGETRSVVHQPLHTLSAQARSLPWFRWHMYNNRASHRREEHDWEMDGLEAPSQAWREGRPVRLGGIECGDEGRTPDVGGRRDAECIRLEEREVDKEETSVSGYLCDCG